MKAKSIKFERETEFSDTPPQEMSAQFLHMEEEGDQQLQHIQVILTAKNAARIIIEIPVGEQGTVPRFIAEFLECCEPFLERKI